MDTSKFLNICRSGVITSNINYDTFLNVFSFQCERILNPTIGERRNIRSDVFESVTNHINEKLKEGCPICQDNVEMDPETCRVINCPGKHIICRECAISHFQRKQQCPLRCNVSFARNYQQYLQSNASRNINDIREYFTQLKEQGFDFNGSHNENPGLIIAIENKRYEIISLLLTEFGANPDISDTNGVAALFRAFEIDDGPDYELSKLLVMNKADLSVVHPNGMPYIHNVIDLGDFSLMGIIEEHWSNFSGTAVCPDGYTIFGKMAFNCDEIGIEYLLPFQENPFLGNVRTNDSTIQILVEKSENFNKFIEFFNELINCPGLDQYEFTKNSKGHTDFITCARMNKPEFLDFLIHFENKSPDFPRDFIDIQDNKGQTALFSACKRGNIECVKILIENGADIGISDLNGITPLKIAIENAQIEVISFLDGTEIREILN